MSRIKEGTTLSGYRCDGDGCDQMAVWTPLVVIPYARNGFLRKKSGPFFGWVDCHVCNEHFAHLNSSDFLGPKMRDLARRTANESGNKPDFDHVTLMKWRVHSQEYISFQRAGGFVPPDDAKAKGEITLP